MMKVAICLSGQARTWKKCLPNWQANLLSQPASFDFFVHFWDYDTMPRQVWTKNVSGQTMKFEDVALTDHDKESILQELHPVSYTFESKMQVSSSYYQTKNPIAWWTVDQFSSMAKASHLRRLHELQTNQHYDLVIRLRSDLFFTKPVQLPLTPRSNTIYITHPTWDSEWDAFRISDIFFMGNSASYDQAAAFYDHMAFIDAADVSGDETKTGFPPELALYYHYKACGLTIIPMWPDIKVMRSPEYIQAKGRLDHYECI